jgi:Na+-transporting NADH:ubiquinone oxidoreductase subunit B
MDARAEFPQAGLSAAERISHLPRRWSGDRVTILYLIALALPMIAGIHATTGGLVPLLAGSLLAAAFWTALFGRLRDRALSWHFLATAIVFALLMPPGVPLWQAMLAISFGIVIGEQVFGGRGYSFLHPAAAALAFLFFSFSGPTGEQANSNALAIAVLPGALLLLAAGLASWRILTGFAAGLVFWLGIRGFALPLDSVLTSSLALGLVFLVCEPVCAASTNAGRWAYGVLAGVLVVLLGEAGAGVGSPGAIVFTSMLASIFAPLIDSIVVSLNARRRRRRQWPS